MSDEFKLDNVTKSSLLEIARAAPRLAYALEGIAVALDASRPHAKFVREAQSLTQWAADEMLTRMRQGKHGCATARQTDFGIDVDGQVFTVRVEIIHRGVSR